MIVVVVIFCRGSGVLVCSWLGENGSSGEDGSKVKSAADTGSPGVSFLLEDIYRRLAASFGKMG